MWIVLFSWNFILWCLHYDVFYTCMNVTQKSERICLKLCPFDWRGIWSWKSLSHISLQTHGLYSSWNSPDQNTGVGNLALFQGVFPTQESNQDLLHCRQMLYQLSYYGTSNPKTKIHISLNEDLYVFLGKMSIAYLQPTFNRVTCFLILILFNPLYFWIATPYWIYTL